MSVRWISFTRAHKWTPEQKRSISLLFSTMRKTLKEHEMITILEPPKVEEGDVLESIPFRIFDTLTDIRDIKFMNDQEYYAYIGCNEIEFITYYDDKNKYIV